MLQNSNGLSKRLASNVAVEQTHQQPYEHSYQGQVVPPQVHEVEHTLESEKLEELSNKCRENLNKVFGEEIFENARDEVFRGQMRNVLAELLRKWEVEMGKHQREKFITDIINDILGFGPLQPLIDDASVTEIMVVGPNKVFVERNGKVEMTDIRFPSKKAVQQTIDKIIGPLGRRCDESTPNVDARLPDGSRVSASIPPIALDGPYITIRKFASKVFSLDDYVSYGSMSPEMAQFLEAAVLGRLNIFCSGGTGSGKTTLLNCLSSYIPKHERVLTLEDSAELQIHLTHPHVERYESRPANVEGKGAIRIQDLVVYSLRKRPDRIVVGECRSGEAMDMLQAMGTGHDGSLSTGHANTPKQMMNRLETMCLMSGMDLPTKAIRETIAGAVHLIVQISRLKDGSRKITNITEVVGMGKDAAEILNLDPRKIDKDQVYLQDIFRFQQTGVENGKVMGSHVATGYIPLCLERFEAYGVPINRSIFRNSEGISA